MAHTNRQSPVEVGPRRLLPENHWLLTDSGNKDSHCQLGNHFRSTAESTRNDWIPPPKIRKQTRHMEQREYEGVVNKGEREIRVSGKAAEIRMDYINTRHFQRRNLMKAFLKGKKLLLLGSLVLKHSR